MAGAPVPVAGARDPVQSCNRLRVQRVRGLWEDPTMAETPTLYVCHGDDGGPRRHPCRRAEEALRAAGIEYEKVIAAHGHPIPFLRKGSRDELRAATGDTKLPALKLADGTVITHLRHPGLDRATELIPQAPVRAAGWR